MEAHMTKNQLITFKKMIEIIKDLTNTGMNFLCTKSGIEISWLNLIGMASFDLSKRFFKYYSISKEEEVIILHVHLEEFYKILKNSVKISNWETMQIKLKNPSSNIVLFKLLEAKAIFQMKLMNIEGQSIVNGRDPDIEKDFDYRVKLPANDLTNVCDIIKEYNTPIRITAYKNRMNFESIENNFSNILMKKKIINCSDEDFKRCADENIITQQSFCCEYLKKFSQMSSLSQDVFICFSSKHDIKTSPILLLYSCPDKNFIVKFLLASKIENE